MSGHGPYSLGRAECVKEGTRALLFSIDDLGEKWVPKSQIHENSEVWEFGQEPGELVVTEWWAEKKGWV